MVFAEQYATVYCLFDGVIKTKHFPGCTISSSKWLNFCRQCGPLTNNKTVDIMISRIFISKFPYIVVARFGIMLSQKK